MATYLLLDTCVWLNLAQDSKYEAVLVAIRTAIDAGSVVLLVPTQTIEEFDRNKQKLLERHEASLRTYLKHAGHLKALVPAGEQAAFSAALDSARKAVPGNLERTATWLNMTGDLLRDAKARPLEATPLLKQRAADRALQKRGPCHRGKNSVADAVIFECFNYFLDSHLRDGDRAFFVTDNKEDFSSIADPKAPHEHLESAFARRGVTYSVNVVDVAQQIAALAGPAAELAKVYEREAKWLHCRAGGNHDFDESHGAFLRSQYGGLTYQLICRKCGAHYDTGDSWD